MAVTATGEGGALVDEAVEGVPGAGAGGDAGAVAERPATKWEHRFGSGCVSMNQLMLGGGSSTWAALVYNRA